MLFDLVFLRIPPAGLLSVLFVSALCTSVYPCLCVLTVALFVDFFQDRSVSVSLSCPVYVYCLLLSVSALCMSVCSVCVYLCMFSVMLSLLCMSVCSVCVCLCIFSVMLVLDFFQGSVSLCLSFPVYIYCLCVPLSVCLSILCVYL